MLLTHRKLLWASYNSARLLSAVATSGCSGCDAKLKATGCHKKEKPQAIYALGSLLSCYHSTQASGWTAGGVGGWACRLVGLIQTKLGSLPLKHKLRFINAAI